MSRGPDRAAGQADVLILCGGRGERLKAAVPDRPKPMAEIDGMPFLDHLISYVGSFGFRRFVLCAGFMAGYIESYYGGRKNQNYEIIVSAEEKPLGTGGALKNAETLVNSRDFIAMNGDSLLRFDPRALLAFHRAKNADATVVLSAVRKSEDFGTVRIGESGLVTAFSEKAENGRGPVNAGVYAMRKAVLAGIAAGRNISLEKEVFPSMAGKALYGYECGAEFIDIGTPERFGSAPDKIRKIKNGLL